MLANVKANIEANRHLVPFSTWEPVVLPFDWGHFSPEVIQLPFPVQVILGSDVFYDEEGKGEWVANIVQEIFRVVVFCFSHFFFFLCFFAVK